MTKHTEKYIFERAHLEACGMIPYLTLRNQSRLQDEEAEFVPEAVRLAATVVAKARDASCDSHELSDFVSGLVGLIARRISQQKAWSRH